MQYPYNFFNRDEAHDYACIEDLKTKIQISLAGNRIANKIKNEIETLFESFDKELANIVEKSLIRNLELWAESLPSDRLEIKYSENQVILLRDEKPYTGLSYRVTDAMGNYSYSLSKACVYYKTVFSVDGKIAHVGFDEKLIPYLNVDKWYMIRTLNHSFIFNLGCKKPILLSVGKHNRKIEEIYSILNHHIQNYEVIEFGNQ